MKKEGIKRNKAHYNNPNPIFSIFFIVLVFYGIYRVIHLAWTCDDIYITFRYVDNFLDGKGIVYNEGEYVEGYTHFLWFILLSLFRLLKFDLAGISIILGIVSYIFIILLFLIVSRKASGAANFFFPFTALALSLNYDFSIWATSGLETSFYTLLLCLLFYTYFISSIKTEQKLLLTGLILALSCITRPDAVIFFIYANILLLAGGYANKLPLKDIAKQLLFLNAIFAVLVAPYLFWKLLYYKDIFPNTYYAKNADESYLGQGFYYIWLFLVSYKSTFISLAGVLLVIKLSVAGKPGRRSTLRENHIIPMLIVFSASIIYLFFFVARVGGDFMFARFIIPILPFLYFTIEVSLRHFLKNYNKTLLAVFLIILALIFYEKNFRDELFQSNENGIIKRKSSDLTEGITDERFFYTSYWEMFPKSKSLQEALITAGKILNPYFKGMDITVVIGGARNYMGYFAGFKNIIVDNGLTDKYIARQTLDQRGRIGHEKYAPLEYLIKRKAVLGFYDKFRNDVDQKPYSLAFIRFKELGIKMMVEIIYYDKTVLKELSRRMGEDFIYSDMDIYINNYISEDMKSKSIEEAKIDYKNLKEFYFDFNNDPREKEIVEYFSKKTN